MSRLFYHVMQDSVGNILTDVSGTFRIAGTGTLATIYGDEALTVILPNPMTNHPSFGSFKAFLPSGDFDFYMSKSGYTFETLTGVQGHGTMAQQDAASVAITGGSAVLQTGRVTGQLAVGTGANLGAAQVMHLRFSKTVQHGIAIQAIENDAATTGSLAFFNVAGTQIGSVSTTATATAYNTSSDVRLKEFIETLVGALDVVRALRPVSFHWQADGSPGVGFLAHQVQDVVGGVVTGEVDAVDADGRIIPQQMDMSKLVPWLTACCQELAQQVQALTARVYVLENAAP